MQKNVVHLPDYYVIVMVIKIVNMANCEKLPAHVGIKQRIADSLTDRNLSRTDSHNKFKISSALTILMKRKGGIITREM